MVTSPEQIYDPCGGHLALDFANGAGRPAGEPARETWRDYSDLTLWSSLAGTASERRAGLLNRAARTRSELAAEVVRRAEALRQAIFYTFQALVRGSRPPAADLRTINAELARALPHACVQPTAEGFEWAWAEEPEALDAPLWPVARAAAELLVSPDRERVKECGSETCLWLFLDRTKNGRRRWCEMKTCGNRAKVREHRKRQRAEKDH